MPVTETWLKYVTVEDTCAEKVAVIVVCGGSSARMNGIDKMFADCGGVPVCVRSISAFQNCDAVSDIVVVIKSESVLKMQQLCEKYALSKVTDIVVGGTCRQESVKNGLDRITDDVGIVLVHDGARPLVSEKIIIDVIAGVGKYSAVTCAVKPKDTVKSVGKDGLVTATLDREALVTVQTPQGFSLKLYKNAVAEADGRLASFTDDCSVVEAAGYSVYTVNGAYSNIKITTPEDIALAETLIKENDL